MDASKRGTKACKCEQPGRRKGGGERERERRQADREGSKKMEVVKDLSSVVRVQRGNFDLLI